MELFSIILLLSILATVAIAANSLAPWVPTKKKDLPRILRLSQPRKGQKFYDLGCGNGKVAFYAFRHSQADIIGIELALPFYLICKIRQLSNRGKRLKFIFGNLYRRDLSAADAVYIFAASSDKLSGKITNKLKRELKPGARVITYAFPIPGWKAETMDKPGETDIAIYLYKIAK